MSTEQTSVVEAVRMNKKLLDCSPERDEAEFLSHGIQVLQAFIWRAQDPGSNGADLQLIADAGIWIGKASDRIIRARY